MKSSFFLVIPKQKPNEEHFESFKESALEQWLEDLPSANYGLSVQLFYDLLVDFNKTEMDACFRIDALEVLRPSFLGIQEYLRFRVMDTGFPKSEDQKKIFKVLISVQREVAISYWISCKELTKRNIGWLKKKETTLAVQRVMSCLSEITLSCSLFKVPVPGWIWIDMHSLYKLGEKLGKSSAKIADQSCFFNKTISIEDVYKRVLLLSLLRTSGLRQKEVIQAYRFCEYFCSELEINDEMVPGQRCQNVIMTDEDREPFQVNTAAFVAMDAQMLFLSFTKIAIQLTKIKKMATFQVDRFSSINLELGAIDKLPLELIEYFEMHWAGFSVNETTPFIDRMDRGFTIGLKSTHELIMTAKKDLNSDLGLEYFAETSSDKDLAMKTKVFDVLSVGSLISLRKLDDKQNIRALGVISSVSMPSLETHTEFEVYLLTERIKAALIVPVNKGEEEDGDPVLFYIAEDDQRKRSYLIMESFQLKNDDVVNLKIADRKFPVVLRKRKGIGLGFWQFECRRIKESVSEKKISKKGYDFI